MKTITLVNEKGGVGKTTLAVHLAAGLAARGRRVMVLDADPQGHATIRLGLAKAPRIYDLLVRHEPFTKMAVGVKPEKFMFSLPSVSPPATHGETVGKLWVVPGNVETRVIAEQLGDTWTIYARLQELQTVVDVVIIDTSPTPSLLHSAIYLASDALIIPTKLTHNAFDGLVETMTRRKRGDMIREQMGMEPLRILGIVPVALDRRTIEHTRNLEALEKQYSDTVWRAIPQRIIWQETESRALPVWALEPNSEATCDAYTLLDTFEERMYVER